MRAATGQLTGTMKRSEARERESSALTAAALLATLFGLSCSADSDEQLLPRRTFADGEFVSTAIPEIVIHFPRAFTYAGSSTFDLPAVAHIERHHLLDADSSGRVVRLVILHFEGFLPENDNTYNYRIPDPERRAGPGFRFSATPVRLGAYEYIHNTWFFDARENIRANPDRELARTARLLEEQGYALPAELRMSRYVRVVDAERRHEFILFYLEPLGPTGLRTTDFVDGGIGAAVFDSLSTELTARSRNAFHIGER